MDASLEVAVGLVQGQLAGAELLLGIDAFRDIAQDQHDLRAFHRQQAGLVEARRRRIGAKFQFQVYRCTVSGDAGQRIGHRPAPGRVEHVGNGASGDPTAGRLRVGGALHVEDHAPAVETENLIRERGHQRTQLGVGL